MTVQAAVQMWSRHDASVKSKDGRAYSCAVKEAYQVIADATDELPDILNAPNLPKIGEQYKGSPTIRVQTIKPNQQSPVFWIIEIEYKGSFGGGSYVQTGSIEGSPLDMPPKVRWGKADRQVLVHEDVDGKAIVSPATGEWIPDVMRDLHDITLSVTRNYAGVDLAATHRYLHSVNSDVFRGFPPGTARLVSFSAEEKWSETHGGYYQVDAEVVFRWPYNTTPNKAWYARVPHAGFLEMVPDTRPGEEGNLRPVRAKDWSGQETAQKVFLDVDGVRLTSFELPEFLEFKLYEPLTYSALGLL